MLPPLELDKIEIGMELKPYDFRVDTADVEKHLQSVGAEDAWYLTNSPYGKPIVPPAMFANNPTRLLHENYDYKAGVHATSDIEYLAPAFVGKAYTCKGRVCDKYNRKGSDYIVIETVTIDEDGREIARNLHSTVFRLGK